MVISRRHFDALARILRRVRETTTAEERDAARRDAAEDAIGRIEAGLVYFCEAENPTFDRAKFRVAARYDEEEAH